MKFIPYILYLYLLGLHYVILSDITSIYGATIDLAALIVSLVALYKSELTALMFGLAAAIVIGAMNLSIMPWEMFLLGSISLVVHQCSFRLNLESVTSRLLLLGVIIFIHKGVIALVLAPSDILYLLLRTILTGTVYTLILGWLFFAYKDGRISWGRIKELF